MTNLRKLLMVVAVVPVLMAAKGCDPDAISTCPSNQEYSDAFLDAAGRELTAVAAQAPHIVQMLGDYDITLQQIRHCIRQQKKKR